MSAFARKFVSVASVTLFGIAATATAGPKDSNNTGHADAISRRPTPDEKLINALVSDDLNKVDNALGDVESMAHPDTDVLLAVKKLLPDPRPSIRQKAARVLGTIHAPMDQNDLDAICFMLKSHDQREADNALKALRGLDAAVTIPKITPLLKSSHSLLVRDACRTLAALGNKDLIPVIEPLLKNPDGDIQREARDAIAALRLKP